MDLWISAKLISANLKKYYNTDSVSITIQDGEDAGQTVPHCHFHIMPLIKRKNNNYDILEKKSEIDIDNGGGKKRNFKEMAEEARLYREKFIFP